jgi:hypothetical protein
LPNADHSHENFSLPAIEKFGRTISSSGVCFS